MPYDEVSDWPEHEPESPLLKRIIGVIALVFLSASGGYFIFVRYRPDMALISFMLLGVIELICFT